MTMPAEVAKVTITRARYTYITWYVDILVYTVVLNLFEEYVEAIWIESFTISLLTAILLKALLAIIAGFEHRVRHYFEQKEGTGWKVLGLVAIFSILFLSKFLILEIVDLVFGDRVELGHFIEVVVLIISMIVARALADWIYKRLGTGEEAEQDL